MTGKRTTMEINGRVYDANSGHILRLDKTKGTVVNHKSIDGFVKSTKPLDLSQNKQVSASRNSTVASRAVHKKQAKNSRLHPAIRKAAAQKASTPQLSKFSDSKNSEFRQQRAATTKRSSTISRHNLDTKATQQPEPHAKEDDIAPPMPSFVGKARFKPMDAPQVKVADQQDNDNQSSGWVKKHLIPAVSAFTGLALLSGFLVYNSLPNLTMRVAASRAGFNASVPSYQPSGYSFDGPTSYGPGRVVITFKSKTDDREYSITQRQSAWDSQSLLENFVSDSSESHVVFEEHGLTIYLYEKDKATWVDDGVWYQVEGTANLSSEQILKIAASL